MDCTRNRSKISVRACFLAFLVSLWLPSELWAAFASQFSLTGGEEYNDNIFFSNTNREHDFITFFTPGLTLLYAPPGQVAPTLTANISPTYQIYARNSNLNNFDNVLGNVGYTYLYSPRLNFYFSDSFRNQGQTRTAGPGASGQFQTAPTSPPPVGGIASTPLSQGLLNFTSGGSQLSNYVTLQGSYQYRPNISFTGQYTNQFASFSNPSGTDIFNTIGGRGVYNWNQDHNLHAGLWISISNARNGDSGVAYNLDLGDDYFSNYNIQLTPTLSLSASTGLSLNTSNSGPHVTNNANINVTKLWETAQLNGGLTKGLTPSYGVSGLSDTTTFFANFNWRLMEKLSLVSATNFSFYDTKDVNFKTFQGGLGLQYLFNSWLSAGLNYQFNWVDAGAGANSTDLLQQGITKSDIVFAYLTARFDIWPNTGLARGVSSTNASPVLLTPFPTATKSSSP